MALGEEKPNNQFHVLIDSDAFVGVAYPNDPHHQQASAIFQELKQQQVSLVTTSFVVIETATVLSHRQGQALARVFLDEVIKEGGFPIIHIDEKLQAEALAIFKQQSRKGSSVVDCANVVVMRRFNIPRIFSFDQVYAKKFDVELITEN